MINEPTILCECDNCQSTEEVSPEYKYTDYSGKRGYYDCEDTSILEALDKLGWSYDEDGDLRCGECID